MSEEKNAALLGDGQDNYAQVARNATQTKAAFQASATAGAAVIPWGAIIATAWSARHTLMKSLVCVCLALLLPVVLIISLPSIIFNGDSSGDIYEETDAMSEVVAACVQDGYDAALAKVEHIIDTGGYDYNMSMDALINYANASNSYDVCTVLAAYSASMEQRNVSAMDMQAKLKSVSDEMFKVTYEEKLGGYQPSSESTPANPSLARYVECTIHPMDETILYQAFHIVPDAIYSDTNTTYAQAIATMADSLKRTLYGGAKIGNVPSITDAQLLQILNGLQCSATRKALIQNALSLVGKVSYFWGGKSGPGWNEEWGTPKLVTSKGSPSSGQLRPYGMDCSGFTDWVYKTTGLPSIGAGSANQWSHSTEISASDLKPGDLGFKARPSEPGVNHVLMYVGIDPASGKQMWVHCSSSAGGVVLNTPGYVRYYRRPMNMNLESENVPIAQTPGKVDYTLSVEVTHYCACTKCCGKNANGITASGKQAAPGMVAMSSHYPFGTKLSINGTLYTVEDRGGKGIESDIARVDIFETDHQTALRKGRYYAIATFYK